MELLSNIIWNLKEIDCFMTKEKEGYELYVSLNGISKIIVLDKTFNKTSTRSFVKVDKKVNLVNLTSSDKIFYITKYIKYQLLIEEVIKKPVKKQMVFEELDKDKKQNKSNKSTSVEKSKTRKPSKLHENNLKCRDTKFKTGIKYVMMHTPFSPKTKKFDKIIFSIRATVQKSKTNPVGIKYKDFEYNNVGVINGRFYIDSEIKKNGYNIPLYFSRDEFSIIGRFGAKAFVDATGFKSLLDFDAAAEQIVFRNKRIPEKFEIKQSFPQVIVIDNRITSEKDLEFIRKQLRV